MRFKKLYSLFFIASSFLVISFAQADESQADAFNKASGINTSVSIGGVVATLIQSALGLLGIIFILLMIYAGFLWMTASGSEEQVTKAKSLIKNAIIGLIIVVAAYSITYFIFGAIGGSAGGGANKVQTN